mmetsp:Transcript_8718/g.16615  ORF Transcript_8718/g.16615 Transcript_8718/m.16615 type:complete len:366 (+) Transcript_8718:62-1159(+)
MVIRRALAAAAYLQFHSLPFFLSLSRPSLHSVCRSRTTTARLSAMTRGDWQPLDPDSLVSAPCLIEQTLCQPSDAQAQLAKDFDYAKAVLDSWKEDEEFSWKAVWRPVIYQDESVSNLHGYCIRREAKEGETGKMIPGIIFFHTGAGPHDMFLLYKAVSLVNSMEEDCVVFIADILGDESGWAWDPDRTRYSAARENVLVVETNANSGPYRPLLQQRIQAALDYLSNNECVDRYAAFGWCLGGHPILEISRMTNARSTFKALVTFHGVFDGLPSPTDSDEESSGSVDVLICHGTEDPFVSDENLEKALATLQAHRFRTSLLQLPAKHGFTNPAQDFNENPAFAFDAESATKAWRQATNLVRQKLW